MPPGRPSKPTRLPVDLLERLTVDAAAAGVSVPELVEARCYPVDAVAGGAPRAPYLVADGSGGTALHGGPPRCACPSPKPKVAASAPICTVCRLPR